MPKHDFISTRDQWAERRKPQTEEEINNEFKKQTRFKSYHAFLAWKTYGRDGFEVKFWEWMETTPTKYDEDGNVYRKRPGSPGFIYKWLLSVSGSKFNTIMLILLWLTVWFSIVMNTF